MTNHDANKDKLCLSKGAAKVEPHRGHAQLIFLIVLLCLCSVSFVSVCVTSLVFAKEEEKRGMNVMKRRVLVCMFVLSCVNDVREQDGTRASLISDEDGGDDESPFG